MKCDICGKKIETTFMNKVIGTHYMKGKKKKTICPNCQKLYTTTQIKEKLNL